MSLNIGNPSPLSLLSYGDLASVEIYYHRKCYGDIWFMNAKRIDRLEGSNSAVRD